MEMSQTNAYAIKNHLVKLFILKQIDTYLFLLFAVICIVWSSIGVYKLINEIKEGKKKGWEFITLIWRHYLEIAGLIFGITLIVALILNKN